MPEPKTRKTDADPFAFIDDIPDDEQRRDAKRLVELMQKATGCQPAMWGTTIVGFDATHYRNASGRETNMCLIGFSPRKRATTVYLNGDFDGYTELLARLGKYSTGKSCLYLPRLEDVNTQVLGELIERSVHAARRARPGQQPAC